MADPRRAARGGPPRQPDARAAAASCIGTFGNVSGVDRAAGLMAIKPSGVPYDRADAGPHGARLARRPARSWISPAPLVRHADPPRALPRVPVRRRRAHALRARDRLRAGAAADPLHGHDPRRLLPRRRAGDPRPHPRGGGGRVRAEHRPRDRRDASAAAASRPRRCRRCSSPTTARSRGARTRSRRSRTRASSSTWRAWSRASPARARRAAARGLLVDRHFLRKHGGAAYYGQTK